MEALSKFHAQLLPETLRRALEIDFYRAHWGSGVRISGDGVDALRSLPTIDKSLYRSARESRVRKGARAATIVHSTGSTGRPLLRYRSEEEVRAYQRLVSGRREQAGDTERPTLLFNCLAPFIHGGRSGVRASDVEMSLNVGSAPALERALDLLTTADLLPGEADVSRRLIATPDDAKIITAALLERHGGTDVAGIDLVVTLTDVLTSGFQEFLREAWPSARVINRFSLSEIAGGATQARDGTLVFDPTVIVEVLETGRDVEIEEGVGELVLTELYPFSDMQPFIRYRTGDLVRVSPGEGGRPRVRLLGRLAASPLVTVDGAPVPLLSMIGLRSRLDAEPHLAREELPSFAAGAEGMGSVLGEWEMTHADPRPSFCLRVAPTFNPHLFPSEAETLRQRVLSHVTAEVEDVGRRGECDLDVRLSPAADLGMLGSRPGVWTDQADRAVV